MAVNLSKGGRVSLSKEAPGLSKILVGLGWDTNTSDTGAEFDLDASAFLVGASGKVENEKNFVFYNNLTSADGSVVHTGDNRTGEGEGDDEAIKIDLSKISPNVKEIDIVVTIYEANARRQNFGMVKNSFYEANARRQNFGMVKNSFMRIVDERSGKEIARYDLEEDFSTETAVSFGKIYFKDNEWRFAANGSGFKEGLAGFCKQFGLSV